MRTLTLLMVAFLQLSYLHAQTHPEIEQFAPDFSQTNYKDYTAWYREYIVSIDNSLLASLRNSDVLGVSCNSAWEIALRVLESTSSSNKERAYQTGRFVGHLESRLKIEIPERWAKIIGSATYKFEKGEGIFSIDELPRGENYSKYSQGLTPIYVGLGVDLAIDNENVTVVFCGEKVNVPRAIAGNLKNEVCFNAFASNSRNYVAIHTIKASNYKLCSIDKKTGEILWTAKVVGGFSPIKHMGLGGFHEVFGMQANSSVFLFGVTKNGFYFEEFDVKNGECKFRFDSRISRNWFLVE